MAIKIAIIGTGAVGTTTAFALLLRNVCAEILLADINELRCQGEAMDLSDALSFSETSKITVTTVKNAGQADIIIICAGKPQKKGQPRTELLETNKAIIKQIIEQLKPINPKAVLIMVTNPVDPLTWYAQTIAGLPRQQIMGSGTLLDSQRLRNLISQKLNVAEESIHAYIIGEHGDSQFPVFSDAHLAGAPLTNMLELRELEKCAEQAKQKVYDIIACKGFTNFGVATCVAAMCENIIFDQKRIMPVSCYLPDYDICMSIPAAIGASGVVNMFLPPLHGHEIELFKNTIEKLQDLKQFFIKF